MSRARSAVAALLLSTLASASALAQQSPPTSPILLFPPVGQSLSPSSSPTFTDLTLSSMTQGSVLFAGAGGLVSQDNLALNFNPTTNVLVLNANAATLPSAPAGTIFQLGGADAVAATRSTLDSFGGAGSFTYRRADGTNASKSALASGVSIGNISFIGYGATAYSTTRAQIIVNTSEAWSDTVQGTEFIFNATPVGSVSPASVLRLKGNGSVILNSAAIATNATDGFLYIASGAGAPSGTPTAFTGLVPLYYDSSNNQLYIYNSGWKQPKTPAGAAIVNWQ